MNGEDLPFAPPKKNDLYIVPTGIRPIMRRTAVEVSYFEISSTIQSYNLWFRFLSIWNAELRCASLNYLN